MDAIVLNCMNGFTLCIEGANLIVKTKRVTETFPISKIQSFSLKEPRTLSPGTIVFRTAQAATSAVNIGFGVGASIGAEKTFFFSKSEQESALRIKDYITNYEEPKTEDSKKVVSVVDEIRGLKSLLDEGILTQEEFDSKKKMLLGL